jgi:hypothetical protein
MQEAARVLPRRTHPVDKCLPNSFFRQNPVLRLSICDFFVTKLGCAICGCVFLAHIEQAKLALVLSFGLMSELLDAIKGHLFCVDQRALCLH